MNKINNEVFNISRVMLRVLQPVQTVLPFQDATMGPFPSFGIAIITLEDKDGNQGESPVYSSYNNILENCLLPILLHCKNVPYHTLYKRLYWAIRNEGFRGAAAALVGQLDIALHDLAARRAKQPLHRYLGAVRNNVKVYGSGGGTNYTFKELETEVDYFLKSGVDCYKMKVGKDFGTRMHEDAERVRFVRGLIGKEMRLAVDANQVWTREQALRFIDLTANENIAWFEEPIHSADYEQIEKLCCSTPVKISFGESERTSRMFPTLVSMGVSHLQPTPIHLAGLKEWIQVMELATKAGIEFSSGGYSLYTSSLMATAPENYHVEYLYSIMFGLEQYFSIRPEWTNGRFLLPEVDGLPVKIDWNFCLRTDKIVRTQQWLQNDVKVYAPSVIM